jgi:hypothetical protein
MSDYRRGLGWRFIDHFNPRLVTTSTYNAIADLHTFQITIAHRLVFSVCYILH